MLRVAVSIVVLTLGLLTARPHPVAADAIDPADPNEAAALLTAFVRSWNTASVDGVMRLFTADAVVTGGWSAFTGTTQVRAWATNSIREGRVYAGTVEHDIEGRPVWRLATHLPFDVQLGLPDNEIVVSLSLRDGRIAAFDQRDDPTARERYLTALRVVTSQLLPPRPPVSPVAPGAAGYQPLAGAGAPWPGANSPRPPHATAVWGAALGATVIASLIAAARRRPH